MSSNLDIQDKPEDAGESAIESAAVSLDDSDDDDEVLRPLSIEEFRSVLEQIDNLGLTWTADVPPSLRAKKPKSQATYPAKDIAEIQNKYPDFPDELGFVIFYALTGSETMRSMIGPADEADLKVQIVRELVIGQRSDFTSEFFFKYAIKVPYFVDLDWEVVVKAFERNVRDMPRIPYALLSLAFRQSITPRFIGTNMESGRSRRFTVAVDSHLIEKLISSLTEAKAALKKAEGLALSLNENSDSAEKTP
jgi:hypothetical protein